MTQGEIEQLPEEVVEIFGSLEKRIMNDIVRRIRINGFSTASADWQVNRLQQLGESEDQIREWTAEALTLSEKELDEIFSDAVYNEFMGHDRAYRVMGKPRVPYKSNMQLQSLVAAIKAQTKGTFENITQTLAVGAKGADGRVILTPLMNFYRETLDNAVLDIESGAFDYQRVLMRTVKVLKNSGIRTITYDHGPSIRVDAAVRRAVLTGFRQVQEKINEQTAADLGTDYYEVSYHVGARPTHQPWQGRVYSWKDLHDICGLGTVTGLHGANCYHDYNAFIPGVSVRTYTDEQLDQMIEEENTPKEYAGKEYTTYEALQEQRKLERNARATREEIMMLQEGGSNKDELILAKARYQGILQVYDDFSEKMGLPKQYERIYLDGLKGDFTMSAQEKEKYKAIKNDKKDSVMDKNRLKSEQRNDTIDKDNTNIHQENESVSIPPEFRKNFDDYDSLSLDSQGMDIVDKLHDLSVKEDVEYGIVIIDGEVTKPFTSNEKAMIAIPEEYVQGENIEIYHSHTNETIFSGKDFELLTRPNVKRVVVVTINGDIYTVTVGDGYRPSREELEEEIDNIRDEANLYVMDYQNFYEWSIEERIYMAIREQAHLICRRFGWRLEGGDL